MKISGLIIASGYSSRMTEFKPLLKFKEYSFLITIIKKVSSVSSDILVVGGYNNKLILAELENHFAVTAEEIGQGEWRVNSNIKVVYNRNFKEGMFTSLQTGVRSLNQTEWILYHFIDQPSLPVKFYEEFCQEVKSNDEWIQPQFCDRNGHPILFNKNISAHIESADSSANLKMIRDKMEIKKRFWMCKYPQILQDIDTDEDYKELLKEVSAKK